MSDLQIPSSRTASMVSVRTDPDASVLEERSRPRQVPGIDAFGVPIEEVCDLRLRQHAVNLARRPQNFRAGRNGPAP